MRTQLQAVRGGFCVEQRNSSANFLFSALEYINLCWHPLKSWRL